MKDEILEELWAVKDQIAEMHGHDVEALVAHLRSSSAPRAPAAEEKNVVPAPAESRKGPRS